MGAKAEAPTRDQSQGSNRPFANASQEMLQLMVDNINEYAILLLDPNGHVTTWTPTAEKLKGYRAEEIIGKHFSVFYTKEDLEGGKCERELEVAGKVRTAAAMPGSTWLSATTTSENARNPMNSELTPLIAFATAAEPMSVPHSSRRQRASTLPVCCFSGQRF